MLFMANEMKQVQAIWYFCKRIQT